jgi:hypothetical protein
MKDEMKQIALRLPPSILDRVDAHADRLKRTHPGMTVSRADAMRGLLLDALSTAENQAQLTAPRAKPAK